MLLVFMGPIDVEVVHSRRARVTKRIEEPLSAATVFQKICEQLRAHPGLLTTLAVPEVAPGKLAPQSATTGAARAVTALPVDRTPSTFAAAPSPPPPPPPTEYYP